MNAMTRDLKQVCRDYDRIAAALQHLQRNRELNPSLAALASEAGLSEYHFQRLFSRWAGVSPKRFLQLLNASHARRLLQESAPVLEAAFAAGLSSGGRLHDLMVTIEAMTPGELRRRGEGVEIRYGLHPSPFGSCLVATTQRGICHLAFVGDDERAAVEDLRSAWPQASVLADPDAGRSEMAQVFSLAAPSARPLHLLLRGSNFQLKVWQALLQIPPGTVGSYGQIARAIGEPGASRAVGSAVGANPIAYLIPCHRVIRAMGELGDYRWGATRKKLILATELLPGD